jgi:glycine dehydrogenase
MKFADRHIGPDAVEQAIMLDTLGYDSLDALIDATVPEVIRDRTPLSCRRRSARWSARRAARARRPATR